MSALVRDTPRFIQIDDGKQRVLPTQSGGDYLSLKRVHVSGYILVAYFVHNFGAILVRLVLLLFGVVPYLLEFSVEILFVSSSQHRCLCARINKKCVFWTVMTKNVTRKNRLDGQYEVLVAVRHITSFRWN